MSTTSNAFTQEALDALEKAIAEGVRRVKYSDKEVEYRSIDEMLKVRDLIKKKLGQIASCGKPGLFGGSRLNAVHSKGLAPSSYDRDGGEFGE